MTLRIGSLFSGFGGLDLGVQSVIGGTVAWHAEFDDAPSRILAHHWPGVPNYGDVTKVDWSSVEPVGVLTGGYPCQPFSQAGRRKGSSDERHLWPFVVEAVSFLRPQFLVFENVRGHLSLGFDTVLADLSYLGYTTTYITVKASDVGAPHRRERLFIFATRNRDNDGSVRGWLDRWRGLHRDSIGGRFIPCSVEDNDDRQGTSCTESDAGEVWRSGAAGSCCGRQQQGSPCLDSNRAKSCRDHRNGYAVPVGKAATCPDCAQVSNDGQWCAEASERSDCLDFIYEIQGSGSDEANTRGQQARAGSGGGSAISSDDCVCDCGLAVESSRGSVRAERISGCASDLRDDARRENLCAGQTSRIDFDAPAENANLTVGDQWRQSAPGQKESGRSRADTRGRSGTPAPDASGNEPERRGRDSDMVRESCTSESSNGREQRDSVGDRSSVTPDTSCERGHESDNAAGLSAEGHDGAGLVDERSTRPGNTQWGAYEPAIRRWETVIGRPAPAPTKPDGKNGAHRLSADFVSWMMGTAEGHVTDPAIGLTRNQQLKALGNGVVEQQAAMAMRLLLGRTT